MNNIRACLQFLCLCLILSAFGSSLLAETFVNQINNPSMTSKSYFTGDDEKVLKNLKIKKLDISVTLNNAYAETHLLVDFYNPTEEQLEGEFVLDLPYDSIVTGYGLDIDGRMVKGVIVEKEKAKKVFEDRIREQVDPGLAEITRENAFKTRVFPINAHQTRSISISFASPVSLTKPYVLPLISDESIDEFSLEVIKHFSDKSALITLPSNLEFTEQAENKLNSTHIQRLKNSGVVLTGELAIQPQALQTTAVEQHVNGENFLAVNLPLDSLYTSAPRKIRKIRIYWDSSLSQEANAQQAIEFIQTSLSNYKRAEIELIEFSDASRQVLKTRSFKKVIKALNEVTYHSATSFEHLFIPQKKQVPVDLCLLVSDGRNTLGGFPKHTLPCNLFTLSSSSDANIAALSLLSRYGGGQHIDLNRLSTSQGLKFLNKRVPVLHSIKINEFEKRSQAEWRYTEDAFRLIVPVEKNADEIELVFNNKTIKLNFSQKNPLQRNSYSAFWAKQRMDSLRVQGESRKNLVALSKKYSVAGEETSFLVLESVEDYVANSVDLPAEGFDEELRAKYVDLLQQKQNDEKDAQDRRLNRLLSQWNSQLEWYEKNYSYNFISEAKRKLSSLRNSRPETARFSEPSPEAPMADMAMEAVGDELEEVIVTASKIADVANNKSIAIDIKAWSPDRVYLKAVESLCGQEFMQAYFVQRDEFGDAPSFYLEMADALARCDDKRGALKIALSALELTTANKDTIRAVAQRLLSFEYYDIAIELLEQVVEIEPDSPQAYRNLALAKQQYADTTVLVSTQKVELYEQALHLLNQVISKPWENNYNGIGLISIMEANLLHKKISDLGKKSDILDKRFIRLLDVDLRILISWNINRTDVDLWVDEPTGERVNYSNQLSAIGGRISNDMTNGYGPEEYLLKRTINGDYAIKVHYYGSDIINPNGAVIVRAHIFRNWGRDNQTVEVADLEFTEQQSEHYSVATVKVR